MMKRTTNLGMACLCLGLLFSSCSKEEDVNPISKEAEENAQRQNALEDQAIPIATLSKGITIERAEKKTGTPPAPAGKLDFTMSTEQQSAFQRIGFEIEFSSEALVTGAYIRFLDVDGNADEAFFDVSLSSGGSSRLVPLSKESTRRSGLFNARLTEEQQEIGISFGKSIPPGRFCYEICLYDAQGNISAPKNACVEVEAWGGNAAIVDEWIFDRKMPSEEENLDTVRCDNGQTLLVDYYKVDKEEWTLVLNEDGSYYEIYDEVGQELNDSASVASCSAIYDEAEADKDKYFGKWSYNEEAKTLTIIDFGHEDLLDSTNNEQEDDIYEEGEVYMEGIKVEIISNELVLTEVYENGEPEKFIFRRK